ncbi:single-stranded-DNA-specific exonuclease RecJ [Miltoncostaea oceani]|uniref:single-stranded-DNA-specific exonuclease RecJ n=1 Tax=Miltoncostaea oceani TaxID=2843216 RepID=UPI001C3E2175|nr:single-stranded-DNA-specific exonuclease RecJ [Miltoncostaea oceani]
MSWRTSRVAYADVVAVQDALGVPEPVAWALVRRGLGDPEAAREFMRSDGPLAPAEDLAGIAEAADRLARAVRGGERIAVHGDYDCDGVCSTAILVRALRGRGADVIAFLPSRFVEGYGVAASTVEALAARGTRVLVCVDCGTSALEALTRAVDLGMDPVVIDHHLAGGRRPPGILANPALGRPPDDLPAAAGVVHMLVRALAVRLDGDGLAPDPDEGIDLVALATVADAVPLVGDNRRRVAQGLRAMRDHPRPGIAALCAAASLEPRVVSARGLGFTLAPCINAAGRLAHPDRALELLLATDAGTAGPIGDELWALNAERREVEREIVEQAIAMVEAEPDAIRRAGVVLAVGDGWHEGVVGIVASRLVERFERPAIVLSRQGETAKGSGRSMPGVDLHALVGAAAGTLTRWGGHPGAVGLELPAAAVARFRDELIASAEGSRAAIARARVRAVDAVVGGRDLTLGTAEALDTLAPFGRGNPAIRLVVPGALVESPSRVGQGKHLQVRLRSGGVHARAIGFRMGERLPSIDVEERHDAVVSLEIERWQGLVGPRVTLEALEPLAAPAGVLPAQCAQACDVACPQRLPLADLRAMVDDDPVTPHPPGDAPPPAGVRDRRGEGASLAVLAALAGADRGVVAVVSDVARRRGALETALEPGRLGVEVAVLAGARCDPGAMAMRLAQARGVPALAMIDYARLAEVDLPEGAHVVLVDPPAGPAEAAWALHRAAGRWLHLVWGEPESELALRVAEEEWELRPAVTDLWTGLRDGALRPWGPDLERVLLGDLPAMRPPRVAARALAVLREIGLVEVGEEGVRAAVAPERRDLDDSPRYRAARARLDEARAYLALAPTLDLTHAPVAEREGAAVA